MATLPTKSNRKVNLSNKTSPSSPMTHSKATGFQSQGSIIDRQAYCSPHYPIPTNERRFGDLEEEDVQKLKSPYLNCFMDVLKLEGTSKMGIASQNQIMNNFQTITGVDCGSYARFSRDLKKQKCSSEASTLGSIGRKQAKETIYKAATVYRASNPKAPTPAKLKPVKTQPLSHSKLQKVEDAPAPRKNTEPTGMPPLQSLVATPHISPCLEQTSESRSEEIRNYQLKSFGFQKRNADKMSKLKEKLDLLGGDDASLPDDMMTMDSSRTSTVTDPPEATNSGPGETLQNPRKNNSRKHKTRNISSSSALNADKTKVPPKPPSSSSIKSFKLPLHESSTKTNPVSKGKPLDKKKDNLNQMEWSSSGSEDDDFQNKMHFSTANMFEHEMPTWELSGLLKMALVCIPSNEEQRKASNQSKLKSKFTIKNKIL